MSSYLECSLLGSTNSGLLKEPNADISTALVTWAPVCFSLVTVVYTQSHIHLNIMFIKLTEVYSEVWLEPSLFWLDQEACVGFGSAMSCHVPQLCYNLLRISSPTYFIVLGLASDPEHDCSWRHYRNLQKRGRSINCRSLITSHCVFPSFLGCLTYVQHLCTCILAGNNLFFFLHTNNLLACTPDQGAHQQICVKCLPSPLHSSKSKAKLSMGYELS